MRTLSTRQYLESCSVIVYGFGRIWRVSVSTHKGYPNFVSQTVYSIIMRHPRWDIRNQQFRSVYTREVTTNMPDNGPSPYQDMQAIQVATAGVRKILKGTNSHKATSPGGIHARVLHEYADQVYWWDHTDQIRCFSIHKDITEVLGVRQHTRRLVVSLYCTDHPERWQTSGLQLATSLVDIDIMQATGTCYP